MPSMLTLLAMLQLAHADGDPHNPVGVDVPRRQRAILDTYDAAQVSRREIDTLLPLEWTFERVGREDLSAGDRWFFTGRLAGSQAYGIVHSALNNHAVWLHNRRGNQIVANALYRRAWHAAVQADHPGQELLYSNVDCGPGDGSPRRYF